MSEFKKVKEYILENKMLEKGDSVIVGLSGGADSVCLLDILTRLRDEFSLSIIAVHVHHGIRGTEADRDLEFAGKICKERNVDFRVYYYNVPEYAKNNGLSEEEAGRKLRYETFFGLEENAKVAVAHNLNDNVETFIHNICRGTGIKGLTGIKAVSGRIIRPLLCIERKEIENYLESNNISFIQDSTNFEEEYTRNKIRLNVLPYLQENINNKTLEHINETANDLAEAEDYISNRSYELYEKIFTEEKERICADRSMLKQQDLFMKKRLIRTAIERTAGKLKDITRIHVNDVVKLIDKQSGKYLMLPYNIIVRAEQNNVIFERKKILEDCFENIESKKNLSVEITGQGKYILGDFEFEVEIIDVEKSGENIKILENSLKNNQKLYTKWFDYDKMNFTVCLRYRQPGDYLAINNCGGKKKLKDYFIDEKIPLSKRDSIPVLADGSHVVWVYGYRISEYYKITKDTKRIIRITGKDKKVDG